MGFTRPRSASASVALLAALVAAVSSFSPGSRPAAGGVAGKGSARPGTTLTLEGVTFVVPQPGRGVWAEVVLADGTTRVVGVHTGPDGSVGLRTAPEGHGPGGTGETPAGSAAGSAGFVAAAASSACTDGAYTLNGATWAGTYRWRFKKRSTPSYLSRDAVEAAVNRAVRNITRARNDCGLEDRVGATARYLGTTTRAANIGNNSACLAADGRNVVSFGNLASTHLGMACWWTVNGSIVEADVKLNKADHRWYVRRPAGCTNRYSVEAMATHEFGHAFGLGHVSEASHAALTMSPIIRACQSSETRLGLGDVRGLEALY